MRSKTFGRALGIGMRVAGKALLAGEPSSSTDGSAPAESRPAASERGRALGRGLNRGTRNMRQASGNFGRAVWNPFALAAGVLWLEITGLFFALFALFFAGHLFQLRDGWRTGPAHQRFVLYGVLLVLFVYFSASSFVRAGRKQSRRS